MLLNHTFNPTYHFVQDTVANSYLLDSLAPYIDCHTLGSGGIYSTASDVAKFDQLFTKNNFDELNKIFLCMIPHLPCHTFTNINPSNCFGTLF